MTPVLNDGQSPGALQDSEMRSAASEEQWTPESQEMTYAPLLAQEAEDAPPRPDQPSSKPAAEEDSQMTGFAQSPAPSGPDSETKEKDTVDANTSASATSLIQHSDEGLLSGFRMPGILPPPKRSKFTSSFLRPGSKFAGKQQSDKQIYNVEVTFKSVDIRNSSLCGYLRIEGLTKDHPTLTTYFEGEIIGTKYTFQTKHEKWGATEKTDMQHWYRFPAWRPLATQAKRSDFHYKNFMEKENVFMRWKEYFLVPDHHVREIQGASFEGFYYICFNQVKGTVSGIYFHAKSEKFQQLELKHVDDMSGFAALEFR